MSCIHRSTILTEEGHECLNCGRVLGHSWGRRPEPVERSFRDWERRIIEDPDAPAVVEEVFSWDVYQPVF